ncbi:hypothetical protein Tco_0789938 [Tanacetum coccineum]
MQNSKMIKKVIELYEKYRRLFKESVVLEDFHAHIDDFDNNDNARGGKNDDLGSDNVGKKKESAAKDVRKKDGMNAEKDGVNDVQEGEADVNEEPEDMLEEVTFTQWIEKNIDWVGEVRRWGSIRALIIVVETHVLDRIQIFEYAANGPPKFLFDCKGSPGGLSTEKLCPFQYLVAFCLKPGLRFASRHLAFCLKTFLHFASRLPAFCLLLKTITAFW